MLNDYIDHVKDEIVQKTQELIQIPSVYAKSDDPSKPFGKSINDALLYTLSLGEQLGFRVKNVDNYCGYIEFGEGEELVGIIGHLDVVPEGEDWAYPPFSATIVDNKIFGRGSIDDKGPVIAALYAMKSVMETCKINKRVRLILGLNEENNWQCINYYKKHEEIPSIGFSPDADFPCIYAEKSILTSYLEMDYSNSSQSITIKEVDCNNNAINVVPKFCSVTLKINANEILMCDFIHQLKNFIQIHNYEIDIYKIDEEEVKLTSHGIQAHAAHPDLGKNAISPLLVVLDSIYKSYNINIDILDFFTNFINTQYDGKNLGIDFKDETGSLTLNVGNFILEDNKLKIGMNLRIPVTFSTNKINEIFLNFAKSYSKLCYKNVQKLDSLYISKDNYLVSTLCNIYNEMAQSDLEPIAIGGATYARAFPNCISFGANFPGHKDMCHQTDEFIDIDSLILSSKIYAKAIYELAK